MVETRKGQLAYRHEEKYLISLKDYTILKNRIKSLLKIDKNTGLVGHYHIRSIYFDDRHHNCVYDNLAGIHTRFKYRIRYYSHDPSFIKLEKKAKDNHYNRKTSFRLNKKQLDCLLKNDYLFCNKLDDPLANEFFHQVKARGFSPSLVIDYDREAYTLNFNDIRITFDTNISYREVNDSLNTIDFGYVSYLDIKHIILEIKYFDFLPNYIRKVFKQSTMTRTSLSKYVMCYLSKNGEELL
ncbi:polyphosphate polymerase domain-containing protein [Haloplasma contractile]|uniref:polyphosphate polymerase domain-containing protein n=1 Tax=Haloplasma contractile TaxID=471825 RepID=UPI0002122489|nr:polyphosphate polymerase domain-containing protein [Haloplasma contractile]